VRREEVVVGKTGRGEDGIRRLAPRKKEIQSSFQKAPIERRFYRLPTQKSSEKM